MFSTVAFEPLSDTESLVALYVEQNLTLRDIARLKGTSYQAVWERLTKLGVPLRPRPRLAPGHKMPKTYKYPQIATLEIGESVMLPRPKWKAIWNVSFYNMARRLGIRVSTKAIDSDWAIITRVE